MFYSTRLKTLAYKSTFFNLLFAKAVWHTVPYSKLNNHVHDSIVKTMNYFKDTFCVAMKDSERREYIYYSRKDQNGTRFGLSIFANLYNKPTVIL